MSASRPRHSRLVSFSFVRVFVVSPISHFKRLTLSDSRTRKRRRIWRRIGRIWPARRSDFLTPSLRVWTMYPCMFSHSVSWRHDCVCLTDCEKDNSAMWRTRSKRLWAESSPMQVSESASKTELIADFRASSEFLGVALLSPLSLSLHRDSGAIWHCFQYVLNHCSCLLAGSLKLFCSGSQQPERPLPHADCQDHSVVGQQTGEKRRI